MNKYCYRVIYSRQLNRMVVTWEYAHDRTSTHSSQGVCSSVAHSLWTKVRTLALSLGVTCSLGALSVSIPVVYAQQATIQANTQAPSSQQPTVLQTGNGIPQVNIQTPNAQGLSHNRYSQFDVTTQGAILNNSHKAVQTQLGGWIQGNPYLATAQAKVILNEVNSSRPSMLRGMLEVAGQKADVIVANPSGLYCNGCGVINSTRTVFTTGQPYVVNGRVDHYAVQGGTVTIDGKGMDQRQSDYTTILAQAVKVNAGLWANKKLTVVTGKQDVSDGDLTITHVDSSSQSTKEKGQEEPRYAIDVAQLGGMYANQIYLIGTQAGVGVRNAGHLGATADNVVIDSHGHVSNSGKIQAERAIQINATQGLDQAGQLLSHQGDIHVVTQGDITQQGQTFAHGNVTYQASSLTANEASQLATGVDFKENASTQEEAVQLGQMAKDGATLAITTQKATTLNGKVLATGAVAVQGNQLNLNKAQLTAYDLNLNATQGEVSAKQTHMVAQNSITVKTPTNLTLEEAQLSANQITTNQQNLHASKSQWVQTGKTPLTLNAQTIDFSQAKLSTAGNLNLATQQLNNHQGQLITQADANLSVKKTLDNTQGTILSNHDLTIDDQQGTVRLVNKDGKLLANNNATINTQFVTQDGQVYANNLSLNLRENLTTKQAIEAGNRLTISTTGNMDNAYTVYAPTSVELTAKNLNNQANGTIESTHTKITANETLTNRGLINSASQENNGSSLTYLNANTVTNQGTGRIYGDTVAIQAQTLLNKDEVQASHQNSNQAKAESNAQGNTQSKSATIAARNTLAIGANQITNETATNDPNTTGSSTLYSDGDLLIGKTLDPHLIPQDQAQRLDNLSSLIQAQGNLSLNVKDIHNENTHYRSEVQKVGKDRTLNKDYIIPEGEVASASAIDTVDNNALIPVSDLHKHGIKGTYEYEYKDESYRNFWYLHLDKEYTLENVTLESKPAQLLAGKDITANTSHLTNNLSTVIAGNNLTLTGNGTLENLDDQNAITKNIQEGNRYFSYTEWHGGLGHHHFSREESEHGALKREQTQHKEMNINTVADHTDPNGATTSIQVGQTNSSNSESQKALQTTITQTALQSDPNRVVKSLNVDTRLPNQSLYHLAPDSHFYLIETDPAFTNHRQWLSSDYFLNALNTNPDYILKRLGDGFYEQQQVLAQLAQLTGRPYEGGNAQFQEQFKELMDAGIAVAKRFNLKAGIALSPEQVKKLTQSIVWLEPETVTLPNGQTQQVLVPKVYAIANEIALNDSGSLVYVGNSANLNFDHLNNEGTLQANQLASITANTVTNTGSLEANDLTLKVKGDLNNIGGTLQANEALNAQVGGTLRNQSTTYTDKVDAGNEHVTDTHLDRQGQILVSGSNGTLHLSAHNITSNGGTFTNQGSGNTQLIAQNTIDLGTQTIAQNISMGQGDHQRQESVQGVIITHIKGGGNVTLVANDIHAQGVQAQADRDLQLLAENNLALESAKSSHEYNEHHHFEHHGIVQSRQTDHTDTLQTQETVANSLSGQNLTLLAGNNLTTTHVNLVTDKDLAIAAGNTLTINADTDYQHQTHEVKKKASGLLSSGGIGFTIGSRQETHEADRQDWQQSTARSTVGSVSGNVSLQAGKAINVQGTDLIVDKTTNKAITLTSQDHRIEASQDKTLQTQKDTVKQSGVTIAFSSAATDTAFAIADALKRSDQVDSPQLNALLKVKAVNDSFDAINQTERLVDAIKNSSSIEEAGEKGDFKVSISLGSQRSESEQTEQTQTHQASTLSGGIVDLTATTGQSQLIGSNITANTIAIHAKDGIELQASQDTDQVRGNNKNSGWNIGVFAGKSGDAKGIGVEGSFSVGKGKDNVDSTTWQNAHLTGDKVVLQSDSLSLKGGKVTAKDLVVNTNTLKIESLQDTEQMSMKQTQAGASGSYAIYGNGGGASAYASRTKGKIDYAGVKEQSGLYIENSSNITVKGNTDLIGGMITTQGKPEDNHFTTGTLSFKDINNHSDIELETHATSVGSDLGSLASGAMQTALSQLGNINDHDSSTTRSTVATNMTITLTDESNSKLEQLNRNPSIANEQLEVKDFTPYQEQAEASQILGQIGARRLGDLAQAMGWQEGSVEKVALHGLIGYLSAKVGGGNGLAGAAGAMSSELLGTYVADYLHNTTTLNDDQRHAIQQVVATAIGAGVGAAIDGQQGAYNAGTSALNVEQLNRELHEIHWQIIKEEGEGDPEKTKEFFYAGCALRHCADQLNESDPGYAEMHYAQEEGSKEEYSKEREILSQRYYIDEGVFGDSTEYPFEEYDTWDSIVDFTDRNNVGTRLLGVGQLGSGLVVSAGGIGLATGGCLFSAGFGCALSVGAGSVEFGYGLDQAYAGWSTAVSGQFQSTVGGTLITKATGMPQEMAELIYGAVSPMQAGKTLGKIPQLNNAFNKMVNLGVGEVSLGARFTNKVLSANKTAQSTSSFALDVQDGNAFIKGATSTDAGQIGNATDMHSNANVDANVSMGNKADSSNVPSSANEKVGFKEKTSDVDSSSESCTGTDCVATDGDSKEGVPAIRLKNVGTKDNIILEFESTDRHEPVGFKPLDEGANVSEKVATSDHQAENFQVTGTENSATESTTNLCADDVCSGGNVCFIAGTLVETTHGLRPIETLDLGDWVWSRQEFGQDYDYRPVIATKATPNQPIYEVVVGNAQGEHESFYTTEEHPFYVEGLGWRKTTVLEAGMALLDRQGNPTLSVIRQQATDRKETVYNIKVEDFSTYHIGQFGVWVHNDNCATVNENTNVTDGVAQDTKRKYYNMNQVFNSGSSFGEGLALHTEKVSKVIDGHSVYVVTQDFGELKKGDYVYLDRAHGDHLEVFNHNGKSKGVINATDGSKISNKTDAAKGRRINTK